MPHIFLPNLQEVRNSGVKAPWWEAVRNTKTFKVLLRGSAAAGRRVSECSGYCELKTSVGGLSWSRCSLRAQGCCLSSVQQVPTSFSPTGSCFAVFEL